MSTGKALARDGMRTVLDHEMKAWLTIARREILARCATGCVVTAETVVVLAGRPPRHRNAMGALFGNMAREGLIEWTGTVKRSACPSRRNSLIRYWKGATP